MISAGPSPAQTVPGFFEPSPGQDGKDVIWLPTAQGLVDRMLDMAKVTSTDLVFDLGSGDGRTVITAAKRGVRALGVEYNPDMVNYSRAAAQRENVSHLVQFVEGDIFKCDFSSATVVTMFLLPQLNLRLRPILLSMKPGTRVVSNSFDMGDWRPDETAEAKGDCAQYCRAMLWVIPARVDGAWSTQGGTINLAQKYQDLTGTIQRNGANMPVRGRVNADLIMLEASGRCYDGKVSGDRMELHDQRGERLVATRS
jgi:SAM-dependent methyltransferase